MEHRLTDDPLCVYLVIVLSSICIVKDALSALVICKSLIRTGRESIINAHRKTTHAVGDFCRRVEVRKLARSIENGSRVRLIGRFDLEVTAGSESGVFIVVGAGIIHDCVCCKYLWRIV